jgi:MOSC domain-containing protein YiiM
MAEPIASSPHPAPGVVTAVAVHAAHVFSKTPTDTIEVVAGMGVRGDAHFGATVQHRSRVAADPSQPNLRQVHLIHDELLAELRDQGFEVRPGDLGENVTTHGIDLLSLPVGAVLSVGQALLAVTGLRNPCSQIDAFQDGLLRAVLDRAPDGTPVRKSGVMAVVVASGVVRTGDRIQVSLPPGPHRPLDRV